MTWTFEKHARNNARNDAARRAGKPLVYDFKVLRDGELVAWFFRDHNHTYYLTDLYHEAILKPPVGRGARVAVRARKQADFAAVLDEHADKIPTLAQLIERKAQREANKAKADADMAWDKLERPELYQ